MTRNRRLAVTWLALLIAVSALVGVSATSASASTTLAWHFGHKRVEQGNNVGLHYTATGVPAGGRVLLMKTYGTTLKKVKQLSPGSDRTVKFKSPPMGQHEYVIVVKNAAGDTVAQRAGTLWVYAHVPLATVLGGQEGTVTVNGALYRYGWSNTSASDGNTYRILKRDPSTCRRVQVTAAIKDDPQDEQYYIKDAKVQLLQEGLPTQSLAVPVNTVQGPATWKLGSGATLLRFHVPHDDPGAMAPMFPDLYVNGWLDCWTENAKLP